MPPRRPLLVASAHPPRRDTYNHPIVNREVLRISTARVTPVGESSREVDEDENIAAGLPKLTHSTMPLTKTVGVWRSTRNIRRTISLTATQTIMSMRKTMDPT